MVLPKLHFYPQKNEIRHLFFTLNKNQFKATKDLNLKYETQKCLEENMQAFKILG